MIMPVPTDPREKHTEHTVLSTLVPRAANRSVGMVEATA
jgi:hypothetical protein